MGPGPGPDLAKATQNPIADPISLPFQANWDFGLGPDDDALFLLNIQPVIPFPISENWNIVNRTIVPLYEAPAGPGAADFGSGDILQSWFFAPKDPHALIWGVGPVVLLPTSTDGSEKLGLGPTVVGLKQSGPWTYGLLANHVWTVAGDADRTDVNRTFLQPFLSGAWGSGYGFTVNLESTYDWVASEDGWTVPLNLLGTKVARIGRQPVSLGLGFRAYVEAPGGEPDWGFRYLMTLLFPSE